MLNPAYDEFMKRTNLIVNDRALRKRQLLNDDDIVQQTRFSIDISSNDNTISPTRQSQICRRRLDSDRICSSRQREIDVRRESEY